MVTIHDIAKIAGVSHTTVSRVLNGNRDVSTKTKEKIKKIIQQYSYIPNDSARNLKLNDTQSIGIFSNNIHNPFLSRMVQSIEEYLHEKKYSGYFHLLKPTDSFVSIANKIIKEKKLNGLIVVGGSSSFNFEPFDTLWVPVVFTTIKPQASPELKKISSVYIDDSSSALSAVNYLCSLEHKKIAIVTSEGNEKSIGSQRLAGYLMSLEQNNIPVNPKLIVKTKGSSNIQAAYNAAQRLLSSNEKFTAIFAITDLLAIGVMRALADTGMQMPQDVSLIGFDGIDIGNYLNPRLTTILQPLEKMALASVDLIIDMVEGKEVHDLFFPTELLIRESCRPL
ncbi:LacI family DNA-binding transcriptional regulator [Spirochaetota bacterium]